MNPSTHPTPANHWTPGAAAVVRVALSHPAPYGADMARTLPESERSWRLVAIPTRGQPQDITTATIGRRKGWEPLPPTTLELVPGVYVLQTGPKLGPASVRARFRLAVDGMAIVAGGCARLVAGPAPRDEAADLDAQAEASQVAADNAAALAASTAALAASTAALAATPPRPVAPTARAATLAVVPVAGEDVSAAAKARILADQDHLAAHGIPLPPPVYEHGYRVVQLGVDNYVRSHAAWAEAPTTIEGLEGVRDAVRREDRREVVIDDRRDLRMDDAGRLVLPDGTAVPCELGALKGLAGLFGDALPQAGPLLAVLPPPERAELFNRQRGRSSRADEIRLRVRTGPSGPAVYALVAPTYAAHDADALATTLIRSLQALPGGTAARGEVTYDPETTRLRADALWHADHVVDLAAGDVFRGGMRFRADDTGGASIRGETAWSRNRCRNLIIVSVSRGAAFRVVHRGDAANMADRVAAGVRSAGEVTEHFVAQWGHLRATHAVDPSGVLAASSGTVAAIRAALLLGRKDADRLEAAYDEAATDRARVGALYGALADSKLDGLDWPVRRDALVELFLRGWDAEQGVLLADVVNGVTRVHEAAIPVDHKLRIEHGAGIVAAAFGAVGGVA